MQSKRPVSTDKRDIVKESQKRIKKALVEGFEYHHLAISNSDHFLKNHASQRLDFPVMFVDLVGSTKMSTELSPDFLSKIITVFSQEMSYVIEYFSGLLLKFVGDASIGYFPFNENLDDIVLCGESIIHVVRSAINPLLLQMGHSGIQVKVTSDYGRHTIVRYGSDHERSHVDIISATMNLSAKMQGVTRASQMVIGNTLYNKLSLNAQRFFEHVNLEQMNWNYHNLSEQKPYQLYVAKF